MGVGMVETVYVGRDGCRDGLLCTWEGMGVGMVETEYWGKGWV